ncbi:vascular-related protein 1 isoform X1 [Capsicum galapagoense]
MDSSMNKFMLASKKQQSNSDHNCVAQDQEESGWTTYLEDFSMENNYNRENSICCEDDDDDDSFGSPSLLSDAASHAVWKNFGDTNINNNQVVINSNSPNMSTGGSPFLKRLNLKKPRNKKISDPDLEDTASSPVNSPKVSSFKQMDINYHRADTKNENFLRFEGGSRQAQEMETVERNSTRYFDEKNKSYMDLKKKGLCLVPLSMLVNYRG